MAPHFVYVSRQSEPHLRAGSAIGHLVCLRIVLNPDYYCQCNANSSDYERGQKTQITNVSAAAAVFVALFPLNLSLWNQLSFFFIYLFNCSLWGTTTTMLALKCTLPVIYINKVFFLLVFIYFQNALNGFSKA